MYQIATRPILPKLGKAKALSLYNIYINQIVTAWIDDDGESFLYPFTTMMPLAERYFQISQAFTDQHPNRQKEIQEMESSFCHWCGIAGDLSEVKAQELLNDITTDGQTIESEKISQLIQKIQPIVAREGMELDMVQGLKMVENFQFK